jgi:hypothetical protein
VSAGAELKLIYVLLLLAATGSLLALRLAQDWMSRVPLIVLSTLFLALPVMIYGLRIKFWLRQHRGLCPGCGRKLEGSFLICPACNEKFRESEQDSSSTSS